MRFFHDQLFVGGFFHLFGLLHSCVENSLRTRKKKEEQENEVLVGIGKKYIVLKCSFEGCGLSMRRKMGAVKSCFQGMLTCTFWHHFSAHSITNIVQIYVKINLVIIITKLLHCSSFITFVQAIYHC